MIRNFNRCPSKADASLAAIVAVGLLAAVTLLATEGANWLPPSSVRAAEAKAQPAQAARSPFEMESSGTTASLRGIHAAGNGVAWASGSDGTVLRTEDSGFMWQTCAMPQGAEKLDFRAIWGWDANTAVAMSSGPGDQSRLYKTTDGCSHWKLVYTNPDAKGFWDAMSFSDQQLGSILGDPVHGDFVVLSTNDEGKTWRSEVPSPRSNLNESAFAASNSSLIRRVVKPGNGGFRLYEDGWVLFGTGGKGGPRVFLLIIDKSNQTAAAGLNPPILWKWVAFPVPLASGSDSAGVFSLALRDQQRGMAVGGDYAKPGEAAGTAAWTTDGGKTWTAATKPPHGYRSAVAWDENDKLWITVGTNGADVSYDDGRTWTSIDDGNWNAISLPWVVGPAGRIAKLVSLNLPKPVAETGHRSPSSKGSEPVE